VNPWTRVPDSAWVVSDPLMHDAKWIMLGMAVTLFVLGLWWWLDSRRAL
jgi:hypothetical protein